MRFLFWILLGFAGSAAIAEAATPLPVAPPEEVSISAERLGRLHSFVGDLVDRHRIAGAVTAVARRGRLVHWEAQGLADAESTRAMRTDDIFALASMTKPVTAAAVMMLLEEGRLRLGDPLEKFLPEFRDMKVAVADADAPDGHVLVPAARSITIHDLLTHRSGLVGAPASGTPAGALQRALARIGSTLRRDLVTGHQRPGTVKQQPPPGQQRNNQNRYF